MEQSQYDGMMKELADTERKFHRACEQVVALTLRLSEMQNRYEWAKAMNRRTSRRIFRRRIKIMEGVKSMYHLYAMSQAENMARLKQQIYGDVLVDSNDVYIMAHHYRDGNIPQDY
jgi:hypothetical protein